MGLEHDELPDFEQQLTRLRNFQIENTIVFHGQDACDQLCVPYDDVVNANIDNPNNNNSNNDDDDDNNHGNDNDNDDDDDNNDDDNHMNNDDDDNNNDEVERLDDDDDDPNRTPLHDNDDDDAVAQAWDRLNQFAVSPMSENYQIGSDLSPFWPNLPRT